jgi:proton-dependent oligopeptide transporter, POT family
LVKRTPTTAPLGREGWQAIIALFVLMLPTSLFWATYEQQGNTIALWAADYTDRHVFGWLIPVTWFQAFNPFMIFAFTPFIVALWRRQGAREPTTVMKMALGCFMAAASWLIMLAAAELTGDGPGHGQASWLWLFAYFVVITVGELYLSPTGLSLVTKVAPVRVLSLMMGVWLAASFIGDFLAGYLGTFWTYMSKSDFFLMMAIISAAAGVLIWLLNWPLRNVLRD